MKSIPVVLFLAALLRDNTKNLQLKMWQINLRYDLHCLLSLGQSKEVDRKRKKACEVRSSCLLR